MIVAIHNIEMDCVSESTLSSSKYQGGGLPADIVAGKEFAAARSDIVNDILVTHSRAPITWENACQITQVIAS